jgi:isopenicillin-N epimerase
VFVDAAHAPGLLDTPVAEIGADFWLGNLHKWAYAPRGTALLAVAPAWRDRVRPLVVSWQQPKGFPANVEVAGARDYTSWLAAPAGLYVLRTLGIEAVLAHNVALAAYGQRVVADALGVEPVESGLPMSVVPLPRGVAADPESATALRKQISDELATEVAVNAWRGQGLLRLSAQVYNRPEEYEKLAGALPGLLARLGPAAP